MPVFRLGYPSIATVSDLNFYRARRKSPSIRAGRRGLQAGRRYGLAFSLAVSLAAGLAATPTARAQTSDPAMTLAMNKFDAGRKAFENGQFEEARVAFRDSNALAASPNSKLYLARCYRALGKVASAYTTYRQAAREAQDRLTSTQEKRYGATRDFATREGAELEAKVPRLTLAVPAGVPDGFIVTENGEPVAKAGWGIAAEVDPGEVTIEANGPRVVPFKKVVTLAPGAQVRVEVDAKKLPTATVALTLLSLPSGLSLSLDGQPLDVSGARTAHPVDVGPHSFQASAPGYVTFTWTKDLVDTEAARIEVTLAPDTRALRGGPTRTPKWVFFTVAGTAVVAAGVGAGIAAHASSQQSGQESKDPYARDPNVKSSVETQATVSDILFIGAGVLGAGAVVLAFTTPWKTHDSATQGLTLAPWLTGSSAGLGAHGSF